MGSRLTTVKLATRSRFKPLGPIKSPPRLTAFVMLRSVSIESCTDHIVKGNAAQRLSTFLFGGRQHRQHDFNDQLRLRLLIGCVDRSGGPKNFVDCHAMAFARKLITTLRAADALEDAAAHQ